MSCLPILPAFKPIKSNYRFTYSFHLLSFNFHESHMAQMIAAANLSWGRHRILQQCRPRNGTAEMWKIMKGRPANSCSTCSAFLLDDTCAGFERWQKIYGETDDVNPVQKVTQRKVSRRSQVRCAAIVSCFHFWQESWFQGYPSGPCRDRG